ncbi:MAG: TldD/PmbA family protein [Candidatus Cloacimonetes bacterium]|nr:TldD/PmbA family protein [Candidatus Cloacimonadota bacterium]
MEKLLEMAKKVSDQAEVYSQESSSNSVSFENAKLHDIESDFSAGIALRIIKDGKLGFAYTRNLNNREELITNALHSLKGKVAADYQLPSYQKLPQIDTYDKNIDEISSSKLVEECSRIDEIWKEKTNAEITIASWTFTDEMRLINSKGVDYSKKTSGYGVYGGLGFPGGASGISRSINNKSFIPFLENSSNEMIMLFNIGEKIVQPKSGKMKVLFMPGSLYTLNWRFTTGTSAQSIYEKTSPVADNIGQQIFSDKLTIFTDPLNENFNSATAFDSEGIPTTKFILVENGVLKSFYYDLYYAQKLGVKSTGHGYKQYYYGKPTPQAAHLTYLPGDASFAEMIKMIDRGIILEGAMGAHSGNIPNGDYSIGVDPGLYVENGEIIGRVKDAMIAGNSYETMKNVIAIENKAHNIGSRMPAVLFDNVSFSGK